MVKYRVTIEEQDASLIVEALSLLEFTLYNSPANFHVKLLLISLYHILGGCNGAEAAWSRLEAKHVQLASLGWLHAARLPAAAPRLAHHRLAQAHAFYTHHANDVSLLTRTHPPHRTIAHHRMAQAPAFYTHHANDAHAFYTHHANDVSLLTRTHPRHRAIAHHRMAQPHVFYTHHANDVSPLTRTHPPHRTIAHHRMAQAHAFYTHHANDVSPFTRTHPPHRAIAHHRMAQPHVFYTHHANDVSLLTRTHPPHRTIAHHRMAQAHAFYTHHANDVSPFTRTHPPHRAIAHHRMAQAHAFYTHHANDAHAFYTPHANDVSLLTRTHPPARILAHHCLAQAHAFYTHPANDVSLLTRTHPPHRAIAHHRMAQAHAFYTHHANDVSPLTRTHPPHRTIAHHCMAQAHAFYTHHANDVSPLTRTHPPHRAIAHHRMAQAHAFYTRHSNDVSLLTRTHPPARILAQHCLAQAHAFYTHHANDVSLLTRTHPPHRTIPHHRMAQAHAFYTRHSNDVSLLTRTHPPHRAIAHHRMAQEHAFYTHHANDSAEHVTYAYKYGTFEKLVELGAWHARLAGCAWAALLPRERALLALQLPAPPAPPALLPDLPEHLTDNRDLRAIVSWDGPQDVDAELRARTFSQEVAYVRLKDALLRAAALCGQAAAAGRDRLPQLLQRLDTCIQTFSEAMQRCRHQYSQREKISISAPLPSRIFALVGSAVPYGALYAGALRVARAVAGGGVRSGAAGGAVSEAADTLRRELRDAQGPLAAGAPLTAWQLRDSLEHLANFLEFVGVVTYMMGVCHELVTPAISKKSKKKPNQSQDELETSHLLNQLNQEIIDLLVFMSEHLDSWPKFEYETNIEEQLSKLNISENYQCPVTSRLKKGYQETIRYSKDTLEAKAKYLRSLQ
ncbi:unnamed protein product [Parnassius apollo]|uniref:(apollo) hypothetical protein n=1 Tax=Parnassius apollo TaxID=110799 RepID=A0A8S3XZ68_PARAO|nr:unnamed protein product [Parnassius apollo]